MFPLYRRCQGREGGFTLLEVMVSLAILGLGVITTIQLFSGGLRLASASDGKTRMILLAREKTAEILLNKNIEKGIATGEAQGLEWTVEIAPYEAVIPDDQSGIKIFKVVVTVVNPGERNGFFTLTTLKTVFPPVSNM
ncbi:MAG: prepilin-type N-terminal cleavage/methylation domain-containing protein [Nitrospiria bacterium]